MGEVVSILRDFHPGRWEAEWEALGGRLFIGQEPAGSRFEGGAGLLALAPPFGRDVNREQALRCRISLLRAQLELPGARAAVLDFLQRMEATRGRG